MAWAHSSVNREAWLQAAERLHSGACSLLGLWGEPGYAHMALMENTTRECSVLGIACEANRYPSIGRLHAPAIRLERAMRDLAGLEPDGLPDARPWLHHGGPYPFLPVEGESLHQIAVGPVHAGVITFHELAPSLKDSGLRRREPGIAGGKQRDDLVEVGVAKKRVKETLRIHVVVLQEIEDSSAPVSESSCSCSAYARNWCSFKCG